MKKNYLLKGFFAAAAVVMLAACDKNEPAVVTQAGEEITVTASHEGGMSRISYNDAAPGATGGGLGLTWSEGDAIMMYRGGRGSMFTLSSAPGSATGAFRGTVPEGTGDYALFFPASKAELTVADCRFSVLGQVQKGATSTAHLNDYNFMTSGALDLSEAFVFRHKIAVLKFVLNLGGRYPKSLTLSSQDGENITVVQKAIGSVPVVSSKQLSLHILKADGTAADFTSFTAYMAVLPSTLTQKLAVAVTCTDGTIYTYAVALPSQVSYAAGKVYDAQLTAGTGGFAATASVFDNATVATATASISGSGASADDPYLISSAADLKWMISQIGGELTRFAYYGKFFKLTTDIRIATTTWTPIGNVAYKFQGHFDGGGHTVSGTMTAASDGSVSIGFFGYIAEGSVKNLNISADVVATGISYGASAGGVAVSIEGNATTGVYASISNCTMSGNITVSRTEPYPVNVYAAGIVTHKNQATTITGCSNYGNISATNDSFHIYCGGINASSLNENTTYPSVISYCTNYGNVSAESSTGRIFVAGISGSAKGTIKYCRNEGAISGSANNTTMYSYIGGIMGDFSGTAHTSHNASSSISFSGTGHNYVGRFVGELYDSGVVYSCCTSVPVAGVSVIGNNVSITATDNTAEH